MTPGERARRDVLGDDYVDAALAGAGDDPAGQAFQAFVMDRAWGEWARPDLGRRERSLLTIGILAALGRDDELAIHLRGARRNGLTEAELDEVVRHVAAYAGMPAALATRRAVVATRLGD
jgi:alkylhydroperoxidase/carboxymuconolactone decarboxylase family protein YurZ